ncbi:alpha/beta hydrolase family protein [Derxia gummosa]|uniref:Alpha/beta hydrolase family protein n=2 Tax=Derxia TaxID=203697 RepID=A0A9U5C4K7_9BURK|nr:alpha/beta fold hydrolase [Derxia gummosa]
MPRTGVPRGEPPAALRAQTPLPPYPYRSEDVVYVNERSHLQLAGTLTVPQGAGPFPAVILISGSGPQDRDESYYGHKPFLVLADHLSRHGIAVLRVDDRGVGGSQPGLREATTADLATDVEAGVAWLRTRSEIDPDRVGLIGHSEGGLIAPMVAADDPRIAFIVLLAGVGVPGAEDVLAQVKAIKEASGAPPDRVEEALAVARAVQRAAVGQPDLRQARAELMRTLAAGGMPAEQARRESSSIYSAWFRYFLAYDPAPTLARVRCPVLALGGSKDLQVPSPLNLGAIRSALASNRDTTIAELPGLNHLFQTADKGLPSEYAFIEETLAPEMLNLVGRWVGARATAVRATAAVR